MSLPLAMLLGLPQAESTFHSLHGSSIYLHVSNWWPTCLSKALQCSSFEDLDLRLYYTFSGAEFHHLMGCQKEGGT